MNFFGVFIFRADYFSIFLFIIFFNFKENKFKENIFKSAGPAQYNMKRINFLIYSYIAPGNFSLKHKEKLPKKKLFVS